MPYTFSDLPFLLTLPLLLVGSAFFSGSETALFGLSMHQRFRITNAGGLGGRAVAALFDDQRQLLVTLMLGNMIVNVLYFVICAALLLKLDPQQVHVGWIVAAMIVPLLGIIVFGEVIPKLLANTVGAGWMRFAALPLLAVHRANMPLVAGLSRWVVEPLGRLLAPAAPGAALSSDEMEALLAMSQRRGVIGADEQQLLGEVLFLSQAKVRDLMVPRVDIIAIDVNRPHKHLRHLIETNRLSKFVAIDRDLDHVLGLIYTRQYLLAARDDKIIDLRRLVRQVRFIPELQKLNQLLEDFRKTRTKLAMVVDEYGGTAGLVTLKDVAEWLFGDLDMDAGPGKTEQSTAQRVAPGLWRVSGRLSVHDWAEAFGAENLPPRVATVGGLVMALMGRVPQVGDQTALSDLTLEVEAMDGGRVESVLLRLTVFDHESAQPASGDHPPSVEGGDEA